ncbi:type 1 fimbrial protein, partial [Klebsiella sp. C382]
MKITTLGLAMLFVGLAAGPVCAADGTLNFIGRVVNGACKLEGAGNNGVIDISMGDIPLSR